MNGYLWLGYEAGTGKVLWECMHCGCILDCSKEQPLEMFALTKCEVPREKVIHFPVHLAKPEPHPDQGGYGHEGYY